MFAMAYGVGAPGGGASAMRRRLRAQLNHPTAKKEEAA